MKALIFSGRCIAAVTMGPVIALGFVVACFMGAFRDGMRLAAKVFS